MEQKNAGRIFQKQIYHNEWTIKDVLRFPVFRNTYYSSKFSVPGSDWYLKLTFACAHEPVSLHLLRGGCWRTPKNVNYSFGLKKMDGTLEPITSDISYKFTGEYYDEYALVKFSSHGELRQRMLELAPLGGLTIVCIMNVTDSMDYISRLIKLSDDYVMLMSKGNCDVTLKVKDREFQVHKGVLRSRTQYFAAMFQADTECDHTEVVNIADCRPTAFKDFLLYVYSGKFENSSGDIFELYRIAHKYNTEDLMSACVNYMINTFSVDNVLDTFTIALQFNEKELANEATDFFKRHFAEVVSTRKWDTFLTENSALANPLLKNMGRRMNFRKTD